MKKKITSFTSLSKKLIACFFCLFSINSFAVEILDQTFTLPGSATTINGTGHGQSFTAGYSGPLTKIIINIKDQAPTASSSDIRIRIIDGAGTCGVTVLADETFLNITEFQNYSFNLSTPPNLTLGQTYTILLSTTDGSLCNIAFGSGAYANGDFYSGITCTPFGGGTDFWFETYMNVCLITDQTVTASQSTLCDSGAITISTASSETGVNYYLRDDADSSIVDGPVAGTGSGISLNTGTITSTTTYNVYGATPTTGLKFDGVDDNVSLTHFTRPDVMTIEAWVKNTPVAGERDILSWSNTGGGSTAEFLQNGNDVYYAEWDGSSFPNSIHADISDGKWHHIAIVRNGNSVNNVTVYKDGQLLGTNTVNYTVNTNDLRIGAEDYFGVQRFWSGNLDNLQVWNYAKTMNEIQSDILSCLTGSELGLLLYYNFEDGAGSSVLTDNSPANNNGTLNSMDINNVWVSGADNCASCNIEMAQLATVTVNNSTTSTQTFVECAGFSVTVGTNTYNATGIYTDVLTGSNGCDSTVTTDLTIKQPTTGSQTFVECAGFSVTVGTNTYNATGIYTDVLTGSNGCDSTVTTDLTIKQPTTDSQTLVECQGFSVTVGTNTYNATGVYTDVLTGSNGCDSTVTTDLTIINISDQTVTASQTTLCNSGAVTISTGSSETGVNYYLRDDANDTIIDGPLQGTGSSLIFSTGTISNTITYNILSENIVLDAVNLPSSNDHIRFNTPFTTYGNAITAEAWVYSDGIEFPWAGQGTAAVDNMTANVWLWHGGTWYVNNNGSWISLNWPVLPAGWVHVATVADASGMYIYYNGVEVASNTTGITSNIRNNASSIIDLGHDVRFSVGTVGRNSNVGFDNFSVWNTARSAGDIATSYNDCLSGSETGLVQYTKFNEGVGTTITSVVGSNADIINPTTNWVEGARVCTPLICSSEMSQTVTVTVNNSTVGTDTQVACVSYTWALNSTTYTTSTNSPTVTLTNAAGCDSVVTLDLTINPLPVISAQSGNVTSCGDNSALFYVNSSGNNTYQWYYDGVSFSDFGLINGTYTEINFNTDSMTIQSLVTGGYNNYFVYCTITDAVTGCSINSANDSIIVNDPTTSSQTFVECAGFSITVGSNTYNSTGIYTDVFTNAVGCDSTVTTDLTINQPTTSSQTFVECAGFSVTVGTNTYNATGIYTDVLTGSNGCDSTVTTDLTVEPAIDVTVDNTLTPTLSANQTGATYQWVDCDNSNAPISGEINQTFTATTNGNYAVEITVGSCTETSACENITGVGINETANNVVSIYPNPTNGMVNINLGSNNSTVNYSISSIEGKVVETGKTSTNSITVDLSDESKGVYFIRINTENISTVYKLIKQ